MTDLDPLLREAMSRVPRPSNARPSVTDVRRRARRRNHRRMVATAGALACTGVATTALVIRRDVPERSASGTTETTGSAGVEETTTVVLPTPTTLYTTIEMTVTPQKVWAALTAAHFDPSGAAVSIEPADDAAASVMPTPEQFGCSAVECTAMFNYVVWHELALQLGFTDVREMQASNPAVDFARPPHDGEVLQSVSAGPVVTTVPGSDGNETPTTISVFDGIMLIDGGAPAGAMEDLYQRLGGYNRTIVPGSGKTVEQTVVMPIDGNEAMASSVADVLGIDGFDTWDPSFLGAPIDGMVAVVVGPNYFDRVGAVTTTALPTTTSLG